MGFFRGIGSRAVLLIPLLSAHCKYLAADKYPSTTTSAVAISRRSPASSSGRGAAEGEPEVVREFAERVAAEVEAGLRLDQ